MRVVLNSEDGFKAQDAESVAEEAPGRGPSSETAVALMQLRVHDVIVAALEQRLPRARDLKPWEPDKLHARHIAMLTDRAGGATAKEIALKYKMHQVYVNRILTHPDSLIILGALQALNADKMSDVGARLQGYANEMLTGKMEIFRSTGDMRLKNSIATDILDRAGYGARQQVDLNQTMRFVMPAAVAAQVAGALDESQKIGEVDYRQYTGRRLDESRAALESGASVPLPVSQAELEQAESVTSASPGASPELSLALAEERESRLPQRRSA